MAGRGESGEGEGQAGDAGIGQPAGDAPGWSVSDAFEIQCRTRKWYVLRFATEQEYSGKKDGGGGAGEEVDGVAIGCLDAGGSGAGAVEALGAALGEEVGCGRQCKGKQHEHCG
jgi:hypothetical protein